MTTKLRYVVPSVVLLATSRAVHAAAPGFTQSPTPSLGYFVGLLIEIDNVLQVLVPTLIVLALAIFIWGMVTFIFAAGRGSEESMKVGKSRMLWGVVGLFVIVSVWGLVQLLNFVAQVPQGATYLNPFVNF